MMDKERYVIVTAISTHRMRYCIPVSELENNNESNPLSDNILREWARDSVTMEEVKEFSQEWLGEQISDCVVLSEEETLNLFDDDNDYLKEWNEEQKINYIKNWKNKL